MHEKQTRGYAWLIALLLSLSMLTVAALLLDFRFMGNDDTSILRSFMGYETGVPAHFSLFIHGLLAMPLHWLALAFPSVAWYSVLQITLLVLACTMIQKSIIQCFVKHGHAFWLGTLFAFLFLLCFGLCNIVHITFTITAALLGAAAVLQIFSIRFERASNGEVIRGMLLALLPTALAYALRQVALLPILAFCALSVVIVTLAHFGFGKSKKRSLKPMLISLVAIVLVLGGLMGARQVELKANHAESFLAWQDATADIMDYYTLDGIPAEVLAQVGWSENTRNLVAQWFFLDPQISTEAFHVLSEYQREQLKLPFGQKMQASITTIQELLKTDKIAMRSVMLSIWVLVLCVVGVLFRRAQRRALLAALLASCALFVVMLFYLAFQGRLPLRAFLMPFLQLSAMLMGLLPACLPAVTLKTTPQAADTHQPARLIEHAAAGRAPRSFAVLVCLFTLLCTLQTAYYLHSILPTLVVNPEVALEQGSPAADLDEYALNNPDMLFIYDMSLALDTRLFPDTSAGIPHNVTFWGGWPLRSAESIEQFASFGIDLLNFPADTFLREDVCFASGLFEAATPVMLNYLTEKGVTDVDYSIFDEYGNVHFFQFSGA